MPVVRQLLPSKPSTLEQMHQRPQLMMQEDWRQSFALPSLLVSCSPATSRWTLVWSMEQWEPFMPSATAVEDHLIYQLLSWSTLTATLAPLYTMAQYPSLHFAAPGLHLESSAHVFSCLSSWHGPSSSTSLKVSPWTKWSLTLARESSQQASHL